MRPPDPGENPCNGLAHREEMKEAETELPFGGPRPHCGPSQVPVGKSTVPTLTQPYEGSYPGTARPSPPKALRSLLLSEKLE